MAKRQTSSFLPGNVIVGAWEAIITHSSPGPVTQSPSLGVPREGYAEALPAGGLRCTRGKAELEERKGGGVLLPDGSPVTPPSAEAP